MVVAVAFSAASSPTCAVLPRRDVVEEKPEPTITAKFDLKPPPYPLNALEPHMSQETLEYHWGKHHKGYVENLNKQIVGTELDGMSLEDIIIISYNKGDILPTFNNAGQIWNHDFFWESMKPGGGGKPDGDLLEPIERDFGSFEKFVEEFKSAAATQFGSGWTWLAYKANRLEVGNAVNPRPSDEDKKLVIVKSPMLLIHLFGTILHFLPWMFGSMLTTLTFRTVDLITYQSSEREREDEKKKKEEEDKTADSEAVEMYLDNNTDDSEVE